MSCETTQEQQVLTSRCSHGDTWTHIGDVADSVWDELNRVRDRHDETIDAMRVHNGMTLDEYLASK
jgi:hypothetical protein